MTARGRGITSSARSARTRGPMRPTSLWELAIVFLGGFGLGIVFTVLARVTLFADWTCL